MTAVLCQVTSQPCTCVVRCKVLSEGHRIVSRQPVPAMDHEDSGERVTCSCGRVIRSIFPHLIDRWLEDHDAFV